MNKIIFICLLNHKTIYLLHLASSVFKSFKHHFYIAIDKWQRNHLDRKLGRLQFDELLQDLLGKTAKQRNSVSEVEDTEFYLFNLDLILDYLFESHTDQRIVNGIPKKFHYLSPKPPVENLKDQYHFN